MYISKYYHTTMSDASRASSVEAPKPGPQLIGHLPDESGAALRTFEEIPACVYQYARMGRTRGHDDPACECSLAHGVEYACTDEANCINRLTQVECLADVCRCRRHCRNQRFQRAEYAPVDIVHMPKKGYGLRAREALDADTFVYEYIGEVVNHETFLRRMQQYKDEHIAHFYFMMLQRDEYIDATKRGARARFINHSCNPNCYVSKWHVGKHVRMGIFAKRPIIAGEELTFNYNVDRYGSDPQECHCGEPNCVGTIGGRTQTDIVTMDDLYIEALGIADEVARIRATLPRGKRSKVLDEDYKPMLAPMAEPEAAKVATAMRQACANRNILHKLLTRVAITDAVGVHKALVKLHGFAVMSDVLHEWARDPEIVALALECLLRWPLLARDKAVDSGVDAAVRQIAAGDAEFDGKADTAHIEGLAQRLAAAWEQLSTTTRIARRETDGDADASFSWTERRRAAAQLSQQDETHAAAAAADDDTAQLREALLAYRSHDPPAAEAPREAPPKAPPKAPAAPAPPAQAQAQAQAHAPRPAVSLDDIIRRANEEDTRKRAEAEAAEARAAAEREAAEAAAAAAHAERKRQRKEEEAERKRRRTSEQRDAELSKLERQLHKMVGAIVVRHMSKVKDRLDRERFKRHARELTAIICAKEKKNPKAWPPPRGPSGRHELAEFSDDKRAKIKRFAHEYTKKLLKHRGRHSGAPGGEGQEEDHGGEPGDEPGEDQGEDHVEDHVEDSVDPGDVSASPGSPAYSPSP